MQLKLALDRLLARPGAVKPVRVRFFRGQMQTIITRALAELDVKAVPSRRCFAIQGDMTEHSDIIVLQVILCDGENCAPLMPLLVVLFVGPACKAICMIAAVWPAAAVAHVCIAVCI